MHDAKESKNGCTQSGDSQLPLQLLIIICLSSHHLPDTRRNIIPFFSRASSHCLNIGSVTRRKRGNTNRYSLKVIAQVARSGIWGIHLSKN